MCGNVVNNLVTPLLIEMLGGSFLVIGLYECHSFLGVQHPGHLDLDLI
jgi:hypothetical protein